MTGVRLCVEQEITFNIHGNHFREVTNLADRHEAGIGARHATPETRHLEVDLKGIHYDCPAERKKKGVQKAFSQEDIYMMKSLQPATHAKHVTNEYFLAIRCAYDGCTCCGGVPYSRVPLTIVPTPNP
jgi:hypothetical protein